MSSKVELKYRCSHCGKRNLYRTKHPDKPVRQCASCGHNFEVFPDIESLPIVREAMKSVQQNVAVKNIPLAMPIESEPVIQKRSRWKEFPDAESIELGIKKVRKRKSRKQRSFVRDLVGIVIGGVLAVLIVYFLFHWFVTIEYESFKAAQEHVQEILDAFEKEFKIGK